MGIKLDDFVARILNHPNVQTDEEQRESSEMLFKDSQIDKVVDIYDKFSDIKLKNLYGKWILVILSIWIVFIVTFCFFQLYVKGKVSDPVFITLITTSTANIIGLPLIILKYLFPTRP